MYFLFIQNKEKPNHSCHRNRVNIDVCHPAGCNKDFWARKCSQHDPAMICYAMIILRSSLSLSLTAIIIAIILCTPFPYVSSETPGAFGLCNPAELQPESDLDRTVHLCESKQKRKGNKEKKLLHFCYRKTVCTILFRKVDLAVAQSHPGQQQISRGQIKPVSQQSPPSIVLRNGDHLMFFRCICFIIFMCI
jgi:hypothetical protein